MTSDELMVAVARHLGLPRLSLNADGACAVRLSDGMDLDIQVLPVCEEVRWTLPLGHPHPTQVIPLMLESLLANTTLASTTQRHLAWEAGSERIVLCQTQHLASVSPDTVGEELDSFIAACRTIRTQLKQDGVFQD